MSELSNMAQNYEHSLAQARQRFCASLDSQVEKLDALMWHIEENPANTQAIEIATNMVHKLAGVAPTFGLNSVGQHATAAEVALMQLEKQPTSQNLKLVSDAVEQLTVQLDKH